MSDYFHCRTCRTRVALIQDLSLFLNANDLVIAGLFNRLFNVEASEDEQYRLTYCVVCKNLLGWELIADSQPPRDYRERVFYMRLDQLIYWNGVTLLDFFFGGDNEQAPNNDQDGGADEEQDHDHNGGANEQNVDQDGDANEQVPNEENVDQDGDANEQDLGANEQNADQDGDANEQHLGAAGRNVDQDGDANEQDLGVNGQNADQDGDANEQDEGCCSCLMLCLTIAD